MAGLPSWKTIDVACVITAAGNTVDYKTGDWRSMRPEIDEDKCVRCGKCWAFCPEPALTVDDEGRYAVDYFFCKGCGICARECPYQAIMMLEECE